MTDPDQVEYVWGPCLARLFIHPEDKQAILIFGERHILAEEKQKCDISPESEEISEYIKNLAMSLSSTPFTIPSPSLSLMRKESLNRKIVDLFLEEAYQTRVTEEMPVYIQGSEGFQSILKTFTECLALKKRYDCPYNVRFQYIDIRQTKHKAFLSEIRTIHGVFSEWVKNPLATIEIFEKALEFYQARSGDFLNAEEDRKSFEQERNIIQKDFKGYDDYFGDRIKEELKKKIDALEYDPIPFARFSRALTSFLAAKNIDEVRKESERLSSANYNYLEKWAHMLDVYTLVRLFHHFTLPPHQAKRAIFYAGALHSEEIRDFLLKCGYIDVSGSESEYNFLSCGQCVKLPASHLIKYYMDDHPKTLILEDLARKLEQPKGITVSLRTLFEDKPSPQTALWLKNPSLLTPLRELFPDNEIFLLRPNAVYLGNRVPSSSTMKKRRIRFLQIINPQYISWATKLGFIDEQVPIYADDESIIQKVKARFPARSVSVLQ
jgi:hypothetical protein